MRHVPVRRRQGPVPERVDTGPARAAVLPAHVSGGDATGAGWPAGVGPRGGWVLTDLELDQAVPAAGSIGGCFGAPRQALQQVVRLA